MHAHTAIGSRCGAFSPEEIVEYFVKRNYAGLCVTEHFFNGNCAVPNTLPWAERVEKYFYAYEKVKAVGKKRGLDVFFGFEYTCNNGATRDSNFGTDFLIYGLEKDWLLSKDDGILSLPVNDFMKMVREEGGFVVQAHPFRLETSYMNHISLFPLYTDAIEIYNSNPNTMGVPNELAAAYAKAYGFYETCGSDIHGPNRKELCVLYLNKRAESIYDIIEAIKQRKVKCVIENADLNND